jgi:hypothetical protein
MADEVMQSFENSVDFSVATPSFPPSFDNTSVVSMDCE